MAGLYPDVPGFKMQYDTDGSAGGQIENDGASITAYSNATLITFNNESSDGVLIAYPLYQSPGRRPFIIFPELRDLVGYYMALTMDAFTSVDTLQTSANTTNGLDGTWTTQTGPTYGTFSAAFRSGITTLSVSGIKGIRWTMRMTSGSNFGGTVNALHLYGSISSGQNVDRLRIWHPTLNQEIGAAALDYSDAARSLTFDKTFRIKNNSATLSANSIVLSTSALTDTSPTVLSQLTISQGAGFASTQNIGNLAAGAISAVCTLRLTLSSSATLGLWRQRLVSTAGSWT